MPDFDKLLSGTLPQMPAAFATADADLNVLVADASAALQKRTSGRVVLQLTPVREGLDGTLYALALMADKQGPVLEGLLVGAQGYPIASGTIMNMSDVPMLAPGTRKEFRDKQALEAHFTELFTSSSSPLLIQLSYLLSRK